MGRGLGQRRRRSGFAITAAGAILVMLGAYGIAGTGDVRQQIFAAVAALPAGLLALLAGADLLTGSARPSRSRWAVVSMEEWLGRPHVQRQSARAASN